jgi:hypothetical protein
VEGRIQGDPRPPQRPSLRLRVIPAAVLLAALAGSAGFSAFHVLDHVADSVAHDSKLTSAERSHAAADRLGLDPAPFDLFRAGLRKRERFAVDVPPGAKGPFITRGAVVRAYAAFFFLPAIEAPVARRVFRYRFR